MGLSHGSLTQEQGFYKFKKSVPVFSIEGLEDMLDVATAIAATQLQILYSRPC